MVLLSTFYSFVCIFELVLADWQYRSRPDLSPPQLNITIPAKGTSPGYLFIAPFSGFPQVGNLFGPRQAAPYIFKDDGELVWSGFSYFSIWATNFQAGTVNGEDVLFSFEGSHNPGYGHGHGHITFLDKHYETTRELRAGNHKIIDKHEFHIVDGKTGLVQIYQPVPYDLTPYGATKKQQWIVNAIFQELDIQTGEVLFEWSSLDHVSPYESVLPVTEGQAGSGFNSSDAWDYFHINSVDKDAEGNYLISARDAAAIYKVDGKSGDVIWKLGGLPGITTSDFKSDKNLTFSFQHHARFLHTSEDGTRQVFSLFDNSAHGSEDKNGKQVHYSDASSGKIVEVDTASKRAKLLFNGVAPYDLLAKSQGSTQVLPNGNVLVNWGSSGAVTEYDPNETPIFHAFVDSGLLADHTENYRAFKFNWTGIPNESIAVAFHTTDEGSKVYVSWNGDTRTTQWKLFEVSPNDDKTKISANTRDGFETVIHLAGGIQDPIVVQAFDKDGTFLGESDPAFSQAEIVPYQETEAEKLQFEFEDQYSWKQTYFHWKRGRN